MPKLTNAVSKVGGGSGDAPTVTLHIVNEGTSNETVFVTEEDANKIFDNLPIGFKYGQIIDGTDTGQVMGVFLTAGVSNAVVYTGTFEGMDIAFVFAFEDTITVTMKQGTTVLKEVNMTWDSTSRKYITTTSA